MESYLFYVGQHLNKLRKANVPRNFAQEIRHVNTWRAVMAEFLGTFMFHFVGCASVTYWGPSGSRDVDSSAIRISFAYGLAITGVIEIMGPVSGAHLNPAVSFAFAISREITPLRAILYTIGQCAGAIASSALLYGITPKEFSHNLGGNAIDAHISVWTGLGTEIFFTYFLMTVIYSCTNPHRSTHGLPSVIIGLTVATLQLGGIGYSSCSMNPARSLGPAIFAQGDLWTNHWIYWVGPIIGASLSAISYIFIIDPYRHAKTAEEALEELGRQHSDNGCVPTVVVPFKQIQDQVSMLSSQEDKQQCSQL